LLRLHIARRFGSAQFFEVLGDILVLGGEHLMYVTPKWEQASSVFVGHASACPASGARP
jgi:hypothetical protein